MLVIMDHREESREEMRERNTQPCKAIRINQFPMRLRSFKSIYFTADAKSPGRGTKQEFGATNW